MSRTLTQLQKREIVNSCPKKVFKFNEIRNAIDIEDADKCTLCEECINCAASFGDKKLIKKIGEKEDVFIFIIESTGALLPEDIVIRAMKILTYKLNNLVRQLKGNLGITDF